MRSCCAIPKVDAVYIPPSRSLHCEWTIKAAEHGKHVLCEKPLALNAKEGREMVDACAAHNVLLMEAFMYRYTDRTRQVLGVFRSGVLGEIKQVSATFRFLLANPSSIKLKPELGGGSLYDVGCYPVNFIGMVADEIARRGRRYPPAPPVVTPPPVVSVAVECVREGRHRREFFRAAAYSSGLLAAARCGFDAHQAGGRGDHWHARRAEEWRRPSSTTPAR